MKNEYVFEGTVVCKKGIFKSDSRITLVRRIDISCFKDEIVLMGDNGFRAYPSEDCYLEIMEMLLKGFNIECEILDTKKEGICDALFRAHK